MPRSNYQIMRATEADIQELKAAIPAPEDDPEQYEFLLDLQEQGKSTLLVVKDSTGEVVGYANLNHGWQSKHCSEINGTYLDGVTVASEQRGKRLVDVLLQEAEAVARSRNASEIYLAVYIDNRSAIKAYERNGYVEMPNTVHTLPKDIDPEQCEEVYYKKVL